MDLFENLRVLELASVLAGPSVGQFFAELGADVIKVENKNSGGDVTRTWKTSGEKTDDRSAYFCAVNWGKRSIALDFLSVEGRDVVQRLAVQSDIVIVSYKPGDAAKLGVDFDTLASLNPHIIYGQITGYGSHNSRVGYDAVIQAEAGFMFMNGEPGGASLKMPVALIDVLAAHHLKEGILLGLLNRERTGKGGFIEVSLLQAAISSLVNQATNWLVAEKLPQKHGSSHPNIAPYGDVFNTIDNREIIFAIGSDRQFEDLCTVLNLKDLQSSSKFKTNQLRVENRIELKLILQQAIEGFSSKMLMSSIHSYNIPAGIIQNLQQVFEMEEAKSLLLNSVVKGVRTFVAQGTFLPPLNTLLSPPHLGQHTEEILALLR